MTKKELIDKIQNLLQFVEDDTYVFLADMQEQNENLFRISDEVTLKMDKNSIQDCTSYFEMG